MLISRDIRLERRATGPSAPAPKRDFDSSGDDKCSPFGLDSFSAQAKQQQHQLQAQIQAQQAQLQAQLQAAQAAQQAQSGLSNTRLNPLITRRVSAANAAVPSSAGPLTTSFNLGNGPAPRRTMSIDQDSVSQPPMTAAIGGRFGARAPSLPVTTGLNPNAASFSLGPRVSSPVKESFEPLERGGTSPPNNTPLTANYASTTVISGGTSLGAPATNPTPNRAQADPSWRRSTCSPESQRLASSSPPFRDHSPVSAGARDNSRARPQPLRFNSAVTSAAEAVQSSPSSPEPDVVATGTDGVQTILVDNGHSTGSRSPASISPTTPVGGESLPSREEASKRLYEGLSVARSLPGQNQLSSAIGSSASLASMSGASTPARALSQAVRQPRGPPTEVSELGPRNFASRVRSKAIGGLEAMMMARNRRQGLDVEAF